MYGMSTDNMNNLNMHYIKNMKYIIPKESIQLYLDTIIEGCCMSVHLLKVMFQYPL